MKIRAVRKQIIKLQEMYESAYMNMYIPESELQRFWRECLEAFILLDAIESEIEEVNAE